MTDVELRELARRVQVLEDIEAIRKLKAAYCDCCDGGWAPKGPSHMGAVADLFVEDGVWDGRPLAPRAEGRAAIAQMMIDYRVVPFIAHLVTNPVIEVNGDEATGRWHLVLPNSTPDSDPMLSFGTYDEQYVRTGQGWKFRSLRFTMAGSAPMSASWRIPDP